MSESRRIVLPAPTGRPSREHALPAPRPASLEGTRLLLIDNGQVQPSLPRYGPLLDWLAEDLEAVAPGVTVERRDEDLIQFQEGELARLQAEILDGGYGGLVIAVCHAGVTASSTVLALALERAGLPCVLLCTALGGPLAATMAAHDVPGLPTIEGAVAARHGRGGPRGLARRARGGRRRGTDNAARSPSTLPPRTTRPSAIPPPD